MRIHHHYLLLSTFVLLLAIGCTSEPKVETETLTAPEREQVIASVEKTTEVVPATPSPEEMAAAKAEEAEKKKAEEAALKEEKREKRKEAASKERRRKRRAKRKQAAAEKAAKEKRTRQEAADLKSTTTSTTTSASEDDLSDVDPELLKVVQPNASGGTPRIRFDTESFDFGRIVQGEEIDHQFDFTNVGSAPLVINNVEVTCGCTTPFYPFIPIEPGERGKISVHFSSKGRLGNQSPTITVYTNTEPGTFELSLKGIIDTERAGQ